MDGRVHDVAPVLHPHNGFVRMWVLALKNRSVGFGKLVLDFHWLEIPTGVVLLELIVFTGGMRSFYL